MSILQILPLLAYAITVLAILTVAFGMRVPQYIRWLVLGLAGGAFLAFSLLTVLRDGLGQFWVNHTTNLAGNQVWFDLLAAVAIAFFLIAPRARAVGMGLLPWAIAVILTASLALFPMLARVLWLERRTAPDDLR